MKENTSNDLKDNKQATQNQEDNNQGAEVTDEFIDNNNEIENIDAENIKVESDKPEPENDEDEYKILYRRSILRLVAGGYLLYLSYSGITDLLEDADSNSTWYFYLIFGAFAIIGIILVIDAFRSQIKNRKK